jgi:glycosyltransferase involved in cell wall biosynthesis
MVLGDRIIGHSAFSKVVYHTCTRLAKLGYPVAHIPIPRSNQMGKFSYQGVLIYPSGRESFGEDVAIDHYVDFKADMLITVKENWVFNHIHRFAINLVPYCIIDHSPVSPAITSRLHTAFKVLVPSRFGQRELSRQGIESFYIPHGVPIDVYKPLEDQATCRKLFYLDPDEFVVLYVGWNRARKMVPRMLRIYKRFLECNPDLKSHFMLWTPVQPPTFPEETPSGVADVGVNLLPEIMELGLGEAVRWPNWEEVQRIGGLPEWDPTGGWDMVKLYNSADVLLGCTGGEAFFLAGLEAQACGKPIVVTEYAAAPEICGAGLTVPVQDYTVISTPGTRFALADIDKGAEALTKIMNADKERLARKARAFAERYSWENIIERYWKPFLDECSTELKPLVTSGGVKSWA